MSRIAQDCRDNNQTCHVGERHVGRAVNKQGVRFAKVSKGVNVLCIRSQSQGRNEAKTQNFIHRPTVLYPLSAICLKVSTASRDQNRNTLLWQGVLRLLHACLAVSSGMDVQSS